MTLGMKKVLQEPEGAEDMGKSIFSSHFFQLQFKYLINATT